MRVLVACTACKRQFDASAREPGSQFHCTCGEVIETPRPRGHDASVVRCSSCGAPCEGDASSCRFCGSELTLHERDLHTVCPGCFARISDRAKFCHHCAIPIAPQGTVGELVTETCPVCSEDRKLVSRTLGGRAVTVLECGSCAGLWLGKDVFRVLEAEARSQATTLLDARKKPEPPPLPAAQQGPAYRPCVVCGQLMHRQNYGRRSGVILDLCHEHGLWFDAGELDHALRWVRAGWLRHAERSEDEARKEQQRRAQYRELTQGGGGYLGQSTASSRGGWGGVGDLLAGVLGIVFDI